MIECILNDIFLENILIIYTLNIDYCNQLEQFLTSCYYSLYKIKNQVKIYCAKTNDDYHFIELHVTNELYIKSFYNLSMYGQICDYNQVYFTDIKNILNKHIVIYDLNHIDQYNFYKCEGFYIDKSNVKINFLDYNIKVYKKESFKIQLPYIISPIEDCTHFYGIYLIHQDYICERCHSQCFLYFMDDTLKHDHYKNYNNSHEVIILFN